MKLSLDWNCVIEVEEKRPQAAHVIDLVRAHRRKEIEVALLAVSASENTKSLQFPESAGLFRKRVTQLGWSDLPLVSVPAVVGLVYIDFCHIIEDGDAFRRDTDEIWAIIAPTVSRNPSDHLPDGTVLDDAMMESKALSRWRNVWCDVISAYSHIQASRDIFVTCNTKDFQRKARPLKAVGMKRIATPADAHQMIASLRKK